MSLLNKAQNIYQRCIETNTKAHEALRLMGVSSGEFAQSLNIGWIDGKSFKETLTLDEKKEARILGLFNNKTYIEKSSEVLSFPLSRGNQIVGFATFNPKLSKKTLLGTTGVLNNDALNNHKNIILIDSPSLYVIFRQLGFHHVVMFPFPEGDFFAEELKSSGVHKVHVHCRKYQSQMLKAIEGSGKEIHTFKMVSDNSLIDRAVVDKSIDEAVLWQEETKKTKAKTKTLHDGHYEFVIEDYMYHVQALKLTAASLKVILTTVHEDEKYVDKIDLILASSRRAYAKACAERFVDDASLFEGNMHTLIEKLEDIRDKKITAEVRVKEVTGEEEAEALKALSNPHILDEFVADMKSTGFVGEEVNLKLGFLMGISRLLDKPLSVIVQSSSGTGKSFLLNAICNTTPPEALVFMSKLTPSSLYYMNDLKNKLLCVDEGHGSEGSLYPLRTLQSNHKLVLALPVKDTSTGTTITKQIVVRGPVSFIESTTADSLHPENASRAIILKMDESPEQTMRILEAQRQGVMGDVEDRKESIFRKWQNVGRLLSQCVPKIYIPYANKLKFPIGPNARRDNQKFLSLIQAVALLYSKQGKIHNNTLHTTVAHYKTAHDLLIPLLINPRIAGS